MRIQRLALAGFGPYKAEQHIDFDAFRDDGLFLITGKTGAGKSSILDAICYALYGSIPRFDGTQPRLRSDHCATDDPTFVELQFAIHDVDYLLRRVPDYERPKKSGSGTTTQKGTAELSRLVKGDWECFAVGPRVVGLELDAILGLTKDQFLQVILLAQNRFQEFLLAKNEERQAVLRSLFGTSRFEQIESALVERQKSLKARLAAGRQGIAQQAVIAADLARIRAEDVPAEPGIDWFDAAVETVLTEAAAASATAHQADEEFVALEAQYRALVETHKRQLRRDAAAVKLEALAAEGPTVDTDRDTLALARRAEVVRPQVRARKDAADAAAGAAAAEASARIGFEQFSDDAGTITREALTSTIDDVTQELGTLEAVLTEEKGVPALVAACDLLQVRVDGCDAALEQTTHLIEALPERIDLLTGRLAHAQAQAAAEVEARERTDRLTRARDAATTAAALELEYAEALRAETAASGENVAAAARVHHLMEQRLAGYAAELAGTLTDGDPCAVCGSTVHPAPAIGTGEPVTPDDIARAKHAAEKSGAALAVAGAAAHDVATTLAGARAAAGGRTPEELDEELAAARSALAEATAASAEVAELQAEQTRLRSELANARSTLIDLRAERDAQVKELIERQSRRKAVEERVRAHRGDYDTVSDHVAQLRAYRTAAVRLADAIGRTAVAGNALELATRTLLTQLAENAFEDEQSAVQAQRSTAEIAEYESRIREHDNAIAIAQSTLADPELAELLIEPVEDAEIEVAANALDTARTERDVALSAASSIAERSSQLAKIAASVHKQHTASAHLQEEFTQLTELASVVQGKDPNTKRMRLETYVLAAQLEEIVAAANTRLRIMTSGRYTLQHDDAVQYRNTQSGLGLAILDEHTGRARATHSLSGGETFLASLALALGLA
ncbi:MAG: ATPase, partial [Cryobacterium sp.]|nr:ATPase [Cryobacterium sp.]